MALEVEQLMADYASLVNASKKLPKAKHQVNRSSTLMRPHAHTR